MPSDDVVKEMVDYADAERVEQLTLPLNPEAYRLVKDIEERLGLPELHVYAVSGDNLKIHGLFFPDSGSVFVSLEKLQPPLQDLESILLHEIGHGFEDERSIASAQSVVRFLEGMMVHSLSSDLLTQMATSCLYTAASLVCNATSIIKEAEADRFAVRHGSDPLQLANTLANDFRQYYHTASLDAGKSPFTPTALAREALAVLDNIMVQKNPPTSIRYVLARREAALENQRRQSPEATLL